MATYNWHLVAGAGLTGYYIYTDKKVFDKEEIVGLLERLEADNAALKERLEYIGDLTGIAGIDKPMSIEDCIIALQKQVEGLRSGTMQVKHVMMKWANITTVEQHAEVLRMLIDDLQEALEAGGDLTPSAK